MNEQEAHNIAENDVATVPASIAGLAVTREAKAPPADLSDVEARVQAILAAGTTAAGTSTGRDVATSGAAISLLKNTAEGIQVARVDAGEVYGLAAAETPPALVLKEPDAAQRADADTPEPGFADYVVGYAFSPDGKEVALIEKLRPDWQAGKYNGIGGKVEPGERRCQAMSREFGEEAGVYISADRWLHFRTEEFYPSEEESIWVHHFAVMTAAAEWDAIHTAEEEKVVKLPYPLPAAEDRNLVYNMPYLVPMAYVLLHVAPERRPAP